MVEEKAESEDRDEPIEDNLQDEGEETLPFKYSITSYGADYPVDGLIKRLKDGSIEIPPFQRGYVWTIRQASRFMESLLLGLPVPGIFLSKEEESQKLLVIDGQQRLRSLQYFYEGVFAKSGREFCLKGVQKQFEGLTHKGLSDEDRRKLDDSILHATIVKQDRPSDDQSSIYQIFERLNTGGSFLQPQEIRACIYHGEFNDLLGEINQDDSWRSIFGSLHSRIRDQELILRFFALFYNSECYRAPMNMKEFLNSYMGSNRHLKQQSSDDLRSLFANTIKVIRESIGKKAFRPERTLNAAVFDAVMVGLARRLSVGEILDTHKITQCYKNLLKPGEFMESCTTGTSQPPNVHNRLDLATKIFTDIR